MEEWGMAVITLQSVHADFVSEGNDNGRRLGSTRTACREQSVLRIGYGVYGIRHKIVFLLPAAILKPAIHSPGR